MSTLHTQQDCIWLAVCAFLVFLMQAGFCCLETGLVRAKNSINVAVKNLVDFLIASLTFWATGFALMFGATQCGWIGGSGFLFDTADPWLASFFLFQLMFCGTATTIVSGAVAERMKFSAYLLVSVAISAVVYPVFGHWAWSGATAGRATGWLASMGFVDFAGSSVVHSVGGWVALAAVLRIGPRRGQFRHDGQPGIQGHSMTLAILGVFILWFGWFGFNAGSTLGLTDRIAPICINSNLAAAAGGLTGLLLGYMTKRRPDVLVTLNGALAGLVAITASCHAVTLAAALAIGAIGAAICTGATILLQGLKVDDAVGAVPVHCAAGMWGTLAVAVFGSPKVLATGLSFWQQLSVQALGATVCAAWAFGVGYALVRAIDRFWGLRASAAAEQEGLNRSEHSATTELVDLLTEMERHRLTGRIDMPVSVEPHTEVGQIARQYNGVLQRIHQETERKSQMTRALEASEARIRAIVENAGEGIITINTRGVIESMNKAAGRIFGYSPEELIGRNISLLMPEPHASQHDGHIERYLRTGVQSVLGTVREVQGVRKDGSPFPMKLCVSEFRAGEQLAFMGIVSDLTEEKRLQCSLAQSQKLEAVGQLAAGVAHEINTPMQYLCDNTRFLKDSFSELLALLEQYEAEPGGTERVETGKGTGAAAACAATEKEYLAREIPQALDQMEDGIQRVVGIVRALKQFTHPGSAEMVETNINRCLETTLIVSRNEWKYVADVETNFDPHLPLVPGQPGELNQVFLNLLVNAAQAIGQVTADGQKGTIRVITRRADPFVEVLISDTGGGIPAGIRDRIFEPFFTTKDVGVGSGQGLAIARAVVVKRHKGTIDFASEPGKGTTFTVRLPMSDRHENACDEQHTCLLEAAAAE